MSRYKADDINLLLPSFIPYVAEVLARLKAAGFSPVLFDTLRTPVEALRNAQKGTGSLNSIHMYGAAADVICGEHGWSCAQAKCKFFERVGVEVEALGLVWGGRFSRADKPHFQCVPLKHQAAFRALGHDERHAAARDKAIRQWLRPLA